MTHQVHEPELYEALKAALSDGLAYIRNLQLQGKFIAKYTRFPMLGSFESGLPSFSEANSLFGNSPIDFRDPFRPWAGGAKPEIPSWNRAFEVASGVLRFRAYHGFDYWDERAQEDANSYAAGHNRFTVEFAIKNLIDRYAHTTRSTVFEEGAFYLVYLEWERSIYLKKLPFDILVPILFLEFAVGELASHTRHIGIQRMNEPMQLARNTQRSFTVTAHDAVIGAATHALVLYDWEIGNDTWMGTSTTLSNADAFSEVFQRVDRFFAALRVQTGVETGYSQIVIRPQGWGYSWEAHLPEVFVLSRREYPDNFEAYGWLKRPSVISEPDCGAALDLYEALSAIPENKLTVASKRLNSAYLRRDEADAILDVTIGLETLLADDSNSEIGYRMALRMGALAAMEPFGGYDPQDVFRLCKKIYDYRSAVVHGSRGSDKKRLVKLPTQSEAVPAVALGLSLLRYTINALAKRPELLDSKRLDAHLLRAN
jgi:hypothetical protein